MPLTNEFPARGCVLEAADGHVVFAPGGFRYQLQLATSGRYGGPMRVPVNGLIRGVARQIWTIPAGGNFIAPIFGTPRTVQGRVKYVSDSEIVVQAGVPITLQMPQSDEAIDLTNGPLAVGVMVNAMVMPGVEFRWIEAPAAGAVAAAGATV